MTRVSQSAACALCLEGHEDGPAMDEYQANLEYWEQHKLEIEKQLVSWQNKKPTVTHRIHGGGMVHWLSHECAVCGDLLTYRKGQLVGGRPCELNPELEKMDPKQLSRMYCLSHLR